MGYLQKITIIDGLFIFTQPNSKRWYARFKVGKEHITFSTGESDVEAAKIKATDKYYKRRTEHQLGIRSGAQTFTALANLVIKDLERDIAEAKKANKSSKTKSNYIGILKKYHMEHFKDTRIDQINQAKMDEFHAWRREQFGKQMSSSSLQNHNAILSKVYDKALSSGQITKYHIPTFETDGKRQERRGVFTWKEFRKISELISKEQQRTKNKTSRMLLELLYDYIDFAVATGMRPGTEIENVRWRDISFTLINGVPEITVTVTKGKTTLYTGPREVVVRSDFVANLADLVARFPDRKANDLVFRLSDGSKPKGLSRKFSEIVKKLDQGKENEKDDEDEKVVVAEEVEEAVKNLSERTLYSLRHSYITWNLKNKGDIAALAKQCGTSIEMIDRNYSHLLPTMFRQEFSGVAYEKEEPDSLKQRNISQKAREANIRDYGWLADNFEKRKFV
ncbi:site-specific integrase [Rheinheimera sediminis]|uniref:tyrosine-type recombinase/integrase n=1 Tax=Rheinheimera sp. YQF-1 TaxID=2499626 RepID=UPI000FD97509|nr:tyrosine-type recombinase/integrase [Rheinheimera sp. YQF-1]RVT48612.1 site-specific integrase [Rheinheimera sp. YQF-1]